ncbi:hypothetical protein OIU76_011614, partial [Salix suchowensis]
MTITLIPPSNRSISSRRRRSPIPLLLPMNTASFWPVAAVKAAAAFPTPSFSPQVAKLGLGSQLPYRMAVHPSGDGVLCAFPNSCR